MQLFNKKLPAWMLLAALVIVGAGAATGLVLKDQITGTTTIAVSQALQIQAAPVQATATANNADAFLGTVNDNKVEWAVHIEANNGDIVYIGLPVNNEGGQAMHAILELTVPEGLTVSVGDGGGTDVDNPVEIARYVWKFYVSASAAGAADAADDDDADGNEVDAGEDFLTITVAIEDAQPTGFYEITGVIYPVNV